MQKPLEWRIKDIGKIIGQSNNNVVSSESIFLINFLLYAKPNSYCICKMPNSLLTTRQKDLDALRNYLINEDLLIAAIKDNNYVILVLKKSEKKYDRDIILMNSTEINAEIVKKIVMGDLVNLNASWIHNKNDLLDDFSGNIIPVESFEYNKKDIKSPVYYYNKITLNEKNISQKLIVMKEKLLEHNIISLTQDEINDYEETLLKKENISEIKYVLAQENTPEGNTISIEIPQVKHWFMDEEKETSELAKSMRILYPYMEGLEYIVDKYETNLYLTRNVLSGDVKKIFNHIQVLFENKKIRKTSVNIGNKYDNKIILEIKLEPKEAIWDESSSYLSIINPFIYFTNEYRKAYYLLSKEQKLLYVKLCLHWFNNKKTDENELFEDYSYADLSRNLKTFYDLGLVVYKHENINKYDEYRPIHPLIDNIDNLEDVE